MDQEKQAGGEIFAQLPSIVRGLNLSPQAGELLPNHRQADHDRVIGRSPCSMPPTN